MSIQRKALADTYRDIREKAIEKIKNHSDLTDVKDIIFGEKKRVGSLNTPAIWIVPSAHVPQLRGGHTAQHNIPLDFVTFVKHYEPQEGLKQAQDLALRIYDVILEDRTLDGLVNDVKPTRVDPAYEIGQSKQVYWSAVQFEFSLQRRE